jgi:hypothetical protein
MTLLSGECLGASQTSAVQDKEDCTFYSDVTDLNSAPLCCAKEVFSLIKKFCLTHYYLCNTCTSQFFQPISAFFS